MEKLDAAVTVVLDKIEKLFTNQKEYVSTIAFWCVISHSDALDHPVVSRTFLHQEATLRSVEQTA
jgi:hypothetical protein